MLFFFYDFDFFVFANRSHFVVDKICKCIFKTEGSVVPTNEHFIYNRSKHFMSQ